MAIEYLGLNSVNGPFVVLEGVKGAAYDEIVEIVADGKEKKLGRIVEINEDKAVVQVFEGTDNLSLKNTHTRLTGHPMEIGLTDQLLGRTFNGIGEPIDNLGEVTAETYADVNGKPLNPVSREYPRNYIRTRYLCDRRSDNTDTRAEAPDLFRKRTASRPAGGADSASGVSGRRL